MSKRTGGHGKRPKGCMSYVLPAAQCSTARSAASPQILGIAWRSRRWQLHAGWYAYHQFAFNVGSAPPDQSSKKEKEGNAEIIYFGHEEFITICRRHYRLRVRHQD